MNGNRSETPIAAVRGTRDWAPRDNEALDALEAELLAGFQQAGYQRIRTPVLEQAELHQRRSGAAIVSKLMPVGDGEGSRVCLRPELTAGVVRAYAELPAAPPLPWRVSVSGPVFRDEPGAGGPGKLREFHQVGVEVLGASGPAIDGEVLWLADWSLARLGGREAVLKLGYVGLIQETLQRSGLPAPIQAALVELIADRAANGYDVKALDESLDQFRGWLDAAEAGGLAEAVGDADPAGGDRIFRTLVPVIIGRRTGHEVLDRLRRKWELGRSARPVLDRLRDEIHALAELRGPAPRVLAQLRRGLGAEAPDSTADLEKLVAALVDYGIDPDRVEIDLGFGRGLGFYSRMIFELIVDTPAGRLDVCGGGRYDGLAKVLGSDRDPRGVGFAFGLERLELALRPGLAARHWWRPHGALIVTFVPELHGEAAQLVTRLRDRGARAIFDPGGTPEEIRRRAEALEVAEVVVVRGPWRRENSLFALDPDGSEVEITPGQLEIRLGAEGTEP